MQLLERLRPDVVHFQHIAHLSASLIPLAATLGYPVVVTLHDFFLLCHRVQLIDAQTRLCPGPERGERCVPCLHGIGTPEDARQRFANMETALQAAEVVLTPSHFLAEKMCGYFPWLENRVRAIPLGVNQVPRVVRERHARSPLRVLYVGILMPHKGAHVLIEALKGLPPDAIQVSLYGKVIPYWRPYAERLQQEAMGLPVSFYDGYPHDQLGAILSQHDVLVMPMIWEETFSILTHEALLAGLPVVAARRGALPDTVQDGINGLLFEPENATDLRRCLACLIDKPGLVERLCPVDVQVKTVDEYATEIASVYREIITDPSRVLALQRRLAQQHRSLVTCQQEHEAYCAQLRQEKGRAEEERRQGLTTLGEREELLAVYKAQLRERDERLATIYASTTWKLYRYYDVVKQAFSSYSLRKLKQWLVG
jgi:glycosyltransferase involved in cell wall biosynthesis